MSFFASLWEKIKPHFIWYALSGVLLLYGASLLLSAAPAYSFLASALSQLAATILAGGIFASLLKSYQFSELFKEELEKLFARDLFIEQMKHIALVGENGEQGLHNVFKQLAARSSQALAQHVTASMATMLPVKSEYTFRHYKRTIKITGYSKSTQVITIEDEVEYELEVSASTTYESRIDGPAFAERPNIKLYTLNERGHKPVCVKDHVVYSNNRMAIEIPVSAGKTYILQRVVETRFQLFRDPNIHQQFGRFCQGLHLTIDNEMSSQISCTVQWINFAMSPIAVQRGDPAGRTVCTYNNHGLTFPYQGFILTISPNK